MTGPTTNDIEQRLEDLEGDAGELPTASLSMLLSYPDRYTLVDEDRRIYRNEKTGDLVTEPWTGGRATPP